MMRKRFAALAGLLVVLGFLLGQTTRPGVPETILPLGLLQDIINEASGDLALQNEIVLTAVNRNRLPQEYSSTYFETDFILKKLKEYGIESSEIIDLPTRSETTWDAVSAELWITKPELRKLTDLKEIPACLCSGSVTSDVTAELVYAGPGYRESDYQGKDVKGKIVLVNGMPEMARRVAVEKFGALGLIGSASSHPELRVHDLISAKKRAPRRSRAGCDDRGSGRLQDPTGSIQRPDGRGPPPGEGFP
jgi:hypothetical protein